MEEFKSPGQGCVHSKRIKYIETLNTITTV